MTKFVVDTNVLLRFLTNADPVKAKRAETLFRQATKYQIQLIISLLVIAEIVWTLESFYHLGKTDIASKVETILNTPNLLCPEAEIIVMALDLYVQGNMDFIDAFHAHDLQTQGLSQIANL
ncbi:MAG: type II toxin-antitoxin system VapC family toxin [Nitrospirales bacterium]